MDMSMHRRHLLQAAAAAGWTLAGLPRAGATATATPLDPALARRKLVVVMLRGAVDGLSVVAPYAEPAYARERPGVALPAPGAEGGLLKLDARFGLHPALAMLQPWWREGALGFVHASGSPDKTRSHFDAQDYMESGTPGRKSTPDGWMNRLLGALPAQQASAAATRAISMGNTPPRIFAGPNSVASLGLGPRAGQTQAIDRPTMQAALGKLYGQDPSLDRTYREASSSRGEMRKHMAADDAASGAQPAMAGRMDGGMSKDASADAGAPSARSFAADAQRLGTLIRRDPHTQLAFTSVGGWDTHVNQGAATGQLANRLASLGEGLDALARGLGDALQDTVIVVMSEFGRTLRQNGTNGTDHGRANAMWLLGGPVAGGKVLGEWPGLEDAALEDRRDLAVSTDFRSVLTPILQRHLGLGDAALAQVLPGFEARALAGGQVLRG